MAKSVYLTPSYINIEYSAINFFFKWTPKRTKVVSGLKTNKEIDKGNSFILLIV